MATEVWHRNPHTYIRELVECGVYQIAWDRGFLIKKSIDPIAHANLYYGQTYPWRLLLVGPQGTAEYKSGDTLGKPSAVYPTWTYGEDPLLLEDMIANPAGSDISACSDMRVEADERPVLGQEHRILITDLPPANRGPARQILRYIKELQDDHPECIIHLHGLYSYRVAFGLGFASADMDDRTTAAKGKVVMPAGNELRYEETVKHAHWVKQMGFIPKDLEIPRNRCMFNIRSAEWAGKHFGELFAFKLSRTPSSELALAKPDTEFKPPAGRIMTPGAIVKPGDKMQCNTCSLQIGCKHFRAGAVCTLPDAEPKRLATMFQTRDADMIIDGLGTLMAAGANRLESAMGWEEFGGELDPEVTKMLNSLFAQGVSLAKLLDPGLRGGVKVNVGVGAGGSAAVQVNSGNPNTLIAGVIRELEKQGVARENITPAMVEGVLAGMGAGASQAQAIDGQVIDV